MINLSFYSMTQNEISELSKGYNLAVTSKPITREEIIVSSVKSSIRTQKMNRVAFKNRESKSIIPVLSADERNAIVMLNADVYDSSINVFCQNGSYNPIARDPTWNNDSPQIFLKCEFPWNLISGDSKSCRPYGLSKITKSSVPFRSIVYLINSSSYAVDKY